MLSWWTDDPAVLAILVRGEFAAECRDRDRGEEDDPEAAPLAPGLARAACRRSELPPRGDTERQNGAVRIPGVPYRHGGSAGAHLDAVAVREAI